ncbi:Type I restriction modification DNA specificity domain protein [Macrococcoides canis]|uniref:Type I restriction modification DNA specificity domain protein n=1 Tax=Macrococcoides canis TaxID=1855823 RepID=A0A1W7ADT6_9STAP|nr:restriction endonuclease subunit S [Macrococcus canis]ARQ07757.1 Type I restriction modification DNA specificity domain protein [Macrococcus canis]
MEFKEYRLQEILFNIYSGGTPSTRINSFWDGDLRWLSSGETRERFISKTEKYITKEGVEKSSTKLAHKNSIVIASAGQGYTRGQTSYLLEDMYINQSIICLVPDLNIVDSKYLFYNLSTRYKELRHISDSSSSRGSLTTKVLKELKINLPNITTQKKISKLIYGIDLKILTNTKIIDNLEQLSQTLFKRWFIDFEFPNEEGQPYKSSGGKMVESELGEIPEGWEIKKLGTIVSNKREKYKKEEKLPYVPINELPMKKMLFYNFLPAEQAKSSLIKFNKNDILIGNMRVYFHRVCLAPFEGVTRTTTFVLKPLTSLFRNYILLNLFTEKFVDFANQTSKGTTIPYAVWENGCENFKVIFPNDESILKKFNDVVDETILKSLLILEEIDKLEQLRDTLLPKLLSGEIEIPDDLEV